MFVFAQSHVIIGIEETGNWHYIKLQECLPVYKISKLCSMTQACFYAYIHKLHFSI
jgi:hypothetical protein